MNIFNKETTPETQYNDDYYDNYDDSDDNQLISLYLIEVFYLKLNKILLKIL